MIGRDHLLYRLDPITAIAQRASGAARNQIIFLYLNPRYVVLGFEMPMSNARAIRYRRLALATEDKATADLLLKLADECDRGILCTAEWRSARPSLRKEPAPKAGNAEMQFEWEPINPRR
jgi:hypothetical protein